MMFYSDNPVCDAEQHMAMQERYEQEHRVGKCAQCGEPVHDYDDYYEFEDGNLVHDDCVLDWIAQFKK